MSGIHTLFYYKCMLDYCLFLYDAHEKAKPRPSQKLLTVVYMIGSSIGMLITLMYSNMQNTKC